MSVESTTEAALVRSIDHVDRAGAASPACKICRFRTSLRANGEYTDDAEVSGSPPLTPPSQGGERYAPTARMRNGGTRLAVGLLQPSQPQLAPRRARLQSEPANATAAEQGASPPPRTWAIELGRARLLPPEPANATAAQQESRPPRTWAIELRGGRGSVRAGKRHRGSAGASPSQNLGHRTWEGEAPSEPDGAAARHRRLAFPKSRKPDYHLIRHNNRSLASTDDRLISQSIRRSRSA